MTDQILPEHTQHFTEEEHQLAEEILNIITLYARAVADGEDWGIRAMGLAARQILITLEEHGIQCIAVRRNDA